jgi:hypothetical protein
MRGISCEESESDEESVEDSESDSDVVVVEGCCGILVLVLLRAMRVDGLEVRDFLVGGESEGSERDADARLVADMVSGSKYGMSDVESVGLVRICPTFQGVWKAYLKGYFNI